MPDTPSRYSPRLKPLLREIEGYYRAHDDEAVERLLTQAISLAPHRLDLRLALGSRYVQSAEIERALACYQEALRLSPGDVDSLTYQAHWWRFLGKNSESEASLARLETLRPERAAELRRLWEIIDADAKQEVTLDIPAGTPGVEAIVVLGYKLQADASLHPILLTRLLKALRLHHRFPAASLVLSGGVPQAGKVEATAMREWFLAQGVEEGRLFEEGYARDVVENLVYVRDILDGLAAKEVVVVTSAIDVRRARVVGEVVAWSRGSAWKIGVVAAEIGSSPLAQDAGAGNVKIYRDSLRATGLPMLRSYPELVEL